MPNPENVLLPGMYVRVRLEQGVDDKALLVPQQALQRTPDGAQSLMLVNKENKVEQVPVTTGGAKTNWIVTSGLKAATRWWSRASRRSAPARRSRPAVKAGGRRAPRPPASLLRSSRPSRPRAPAKQEPAKQDPAAGRSPAARGATRRRVPLQ